MSKRRFSRLVTVLVISIAILTAGSLGIGAQKLTIGHHWPEFHGPGIHISEVLDAFQEQYPDLEIEVLGEMGADQLLVMIAAGSPPDIFIGFGSDASNLARQGLVTRLTEYAERDGIVNDMFWHPAWSGVTWEDDLWALPAWVDPNFVLVANTALLAEAGLDPNRPPATIEEVDDAFPKLTQTTAEGQITQIAMMPWDVYGLNGFLTWAWAFGGQLYDEEAYRVTFDDPAVIDSVEWVAEKYQSYGGDTAVIMANTPQWANPIAGGRVALDLVTGGENVRQIQDLIGEVSFGSTPYRARVGTDEVTYAGGHMAFVPTGAANVDAAWDFLRFYSASPEGAQILGKNGLVSGYRDDGIIRELTDDPVMAAHIQVISKARHMPPRFPVDMGPWDAVIYDAWHGRVAPGPALQGLNAELQAKVDAYLADRE